jgi:hypothetical protein
MGDVPEPLPACCDKAVDDAQLLADPESRAELALMDACHRRRRSLAARTRYVADVVDVVDVIEHTSPPDRRSQASARARTPRAREPAATNEQLIAAQASPRGALAPQTDASLTAQALQALASLVRPIAYAS